MMDIYIMIFRTVFFYFFITIAYRVMGKREIGQLGVIDLIVTILIAELVAISIEKPDISIFSTIWPVVALVLLEVGLAYLSIKSKRIRKLFGGVTSVIIKNGKINYKEMIKQRYNLDDLLFSLRQQGIKSIEDIEYAFLETDGSLSIFKYNQMKLRSAYPMPLIIDGDIQYETLKSINKSEEWLREILLEKVINLEDVFYAFYKKKKFFLIRKSDVINS